MMIRGETVKFSKRKARRAREAEELVIKEIDNLHSNTALEAGTKNQRILELQNRLELMREPKIQGLLTRTKVKWYEQGEKCSKYFLSLEKRNAMKKSIECIKLGTKVITRKQNIIDEFTKHLRSKYSSTSPSVNSDIYLEQNIRNKLDEYQKGELEKPVTFKELTQALNSMKKGKSPGANGFTAPFFKQFWSHIGPFFFRVINNNIENSNLINWGIPRRIDRAITPTPLRFCRKLVCRVIGCPKFT